MKRKNEINFIAAQKMMGKTNQSTSFEFILVVTIFIVACGMVGWYMLARTNCQTAVDELAKLESELDSANGTLAKEEKSFNQYQVATDANGNPIVLSTSTDKYGNITYVYKYYTIAEIATEIGTKLAAAQAASTEAKSSIDLTSSVFKTVYYGAEALNCKVLTFSYTTAGVTLNMSCNAVEAKQEFLKYMEGGLGPVAGYEPTRYIIGAKISNESSPTFDDNNVATYKFTISFTVFSDVKPRTDK